MSSLKEKEVTYLSEANWSNHLDFCTPPLQIVDRNLRMVNVRKYSSHTFALDEQQLRESC